MTGRCGDCQHSEPTGFDSALPLQCNKLGGKAELVAVTVAGDVEVSPDFGCVLWNGRPLQNRTAPQRG